MAERSTPCKECRDRRRKCVRTSLSDSCVRCERLERKCMDSDEEPNYTGNDEAFLRLQKQVEELNSHLEEMEKQARTLSPNRGYNDNDDNNKQLTINNNSACNNKPWKLSFHNGSLRIETSICSINDLLLQCLPIQYLSPFHSLASSTNEDDMIVRFGTGKTIRFVPLTIKLLDKCITSGFNPIPLLLPTTFDIHSVVEELINIYFQCRNKHKPLVHEETFMQYYRGLKSPIDSLVCLSICCSVCATPCNHISNDPYKYRQFGDFFYDFARAKLMNQFDETSKRLENLISINLLNEYILSVLKIEDFKKFVTLGYHTCWDLESWFQSTRDQGNTIERTLYSRHYSVIFTSQGFLSLFTNEPMHYLSSKFPEWLLLDDEPPETADFIYMQNHLIRLYNHPYITNVKSQIHYQFRGDPFALKFESIVRLGDVFTEWWKSVPSQYRIIDDWLDLERSKAAIDQCENYQNLSFFNHFITTMIDMYSALLQPSDLGSSRDQILSVVQDLALRRTLHCCQLLIYSRIKSILLSETLSCQSILDVNEHLLHILDGLIIMAFSTNNIIQTAAREMFAQCLNLIENINFMQHHKVDSCHSPLLAIARVNDISSINLSEYFTYPQPWLAMMYDLSHNLDKLQTANDGVSLVD